MVISCVTAELSPAATNSLEGFTVSALFPKNGRCFYLNSGVLLNISKIIVNYFRVTEIRRDLEVLFFLFFLHNRLCSLVCAKQKTFPC